MEKITRFCAFLPGFLFGVAFLALAAPISALAQNVGDVTVTTAAITPSPNIGFNASHGSITLYCPNFFVLDELSFYTRINAGYGTLELELDGTSYGTVGITTTPGYATWTNLSHPCGSDGEIDVLFIPTAARTYYRYPSANTIFMHGFNLYGCSTPNCASKANFAWMGKFYLPLTVGNGNGDMSTTTVIIENPGPAYGDWIFVAMVMIALMSFLIWPRISLLYKQRYES